MNRIISFIFFVLGALIMTGSISVLNAEGDFAGGDGTERDPFLIETKQHLLNIEKQVRSKYYGRYFKLKKDIEFTKADFEKGGAFYNEGQGWNPIGWADKNFRGHFDGNGKIIRGLVSSKKPIAGLFGFVKESTFKNLLLLDCDFSVEEKGEAKTYMGGLVAVMNSCEVEHCCVTGKFSYLSNYYGFTGGIAAESYDGMIKNCLVDVRIEGKCLKEKENHVGGVCGRFVGGAGIFDTKAIVDIKCEGGGVIGGITGILSSEGRSGNDCTSLMRCCVEGSIYGDEKIGGLLGYSSYGANVINNFVLLKHLERKEGTQGTVYGLGRVLDSPCPVCYCNWVIPNLVAKGKRPNTANDKHKYLDGEDCPNYDKKFFWEKHNFKFGNSSEAPWVFGDGSPTIYGFDKTSVPSKVELQIDKNSDSSFVRSLLSLQQVYNNAVAKFDIENNNKRIFYINNLISVYDKELDKELERLGETNLELSAAIQGEQKKLKNQQSFSFQNTETIQEVLVLRKKYQEKLDLFDKEASTSKKKPYEALKIKYLNALNALKKKSIQGKDFPAAVLIKNEIDKMMKEETQKGKATEDVFE